MLALRTSFVSLLYEEDDPVLEAVIIYGGIDEKPNSGYDYATYNSDNRRFSAGTTMSLNCWVWSKTENELHDLVDVWQKSTDEGASWVDINPDSQTRMTVSWIGELTSTTSARADSQYFEISSFTLGAFQPNDAGLYRLKVTGGVLSPAYSANYARIRFDSTP